MHHSCRAGLGTGLGEAIRLVADHDGNFTQLVGVLPGMVAAEHQLAFGELDLDVGLGPAAIASIEVGMSRLLCC